MNCVKRSNAPTIGVLKNINSMLKQVDVTIGEFFKISLFFDYICARNMLCKSLPKPCVTVSIDPGGFHGWILWCFWTVLVGVICTRNKCRVVTEPVLQIFRTRVEERW